MIEEGIYIPRFKIVAQYLNLISLENSVLAAVLLCYEMIIMKTENMLINLL